MVKKLFLVVIMAVGLVLFGNFAKAAYNDVQYTAGVDTLIYLSGETLNLKVISGNVASTTVNASSVVFRMETGSSITLSNTNRKLMSNSLGVDTICTNSTAQITLTATSTTLADITVSIGADCPAINTGGGTSSPAPAPVVIVATTTVIATTTATTTTTTATTTPTVIATTTTAITPVVSKPISQMNVTELQAEIVRITALISQLIASVGTAGNSGIQPPGLVVSRITKVLKQAMSSDEVKLLQTWLAKDPLVYPEGKITGYFGALTKLAVIKFQEKYVSEILTPNGLTKGTGLVGASTRAKLNSLFGQ